MYSYQFCTILDIASIVGQEVFGFTFWIASVKYINQQHDIADCTLYFIDKADAINLQSGNKFFW